jgi:hypothetical protein
MSTKASIMDRETSSRSAGDLTVQLFGSHSPITRLFDLSFAKTAYVIDFVDFFAISQETGAP